MHAGSSISFLKFYFHYIKLPGVAALGRRLQFFCFQTPWWSQIQQSGFLLVNNTGMKKLETPESDYIKTSLRLPPELRDELIEAARAQGQTMNALILGRIRSEPVNEKLDRLEREVAQIKALLMELRDR